MQLVIDIPEDDYKFIKDLQSLIVGGRGNCKTIQKNVINAIRNGTPIGIDISGDAISRKAAQARIKAICDEYHLSYEDGPRKVATGGSAYALGHAFDDLPPVVPKGEWIPIITRELTEEEKEEYHDCTFMYDCKLPEDGEEVLVTTWYGDVALDTFCRDDGCYFENYCDEGDVIAWQPLPKPYEKGGEEK